MERRGRVLIVDDERFNINLLSNLLCSCYEVTVAKSGEQALRSVRSSLSPDLILLDIMMPDMDGYEVCRQLKADAATCHIPIIFVTAMHESGDEIKGFDFGAVDYITKPISPPVVQARVRTHLEIVLARNKVQALNQDLQHALDEQKRAYAELHQTRVELAETQAMAVMTSLFEKFVPKQFLQRIAKEGLENIKAGTVELNTFTIMFSDIRSFTELAETLSPGEIFAFLNTYIQRMQTSIEQYGGFIDKFIGDAIMALFDGAYRTQATNAVQAAIGMQKHLSEYNVERVSVGLPAIAIGIGIHIGPVMLGTLGNDNRMDSTVIGDAANLAARLEGLTKFYNCRIIVSDDVFCLLDLNQLLSRPLDLVVVKGRKQPVFVHEVFAADPEPEQMRKTALQHSYQLGFELFQKRQWRESQQAFQECLQVDANDTVVRTYLERCAVLLRQPPPADWNGAFEMPHK